MTGLTALRLVARAFRAVIGEFPKKEIVPAVLFLRGVAREIAAAWQLDVPKGMPDRTTTANDLLVAAAKARLAEFMPESFDRDAACRCSAQCPPNCHAVVLILLLPDSRAAQTAINHGGNEEVTVAASVPRQSMSRLSQFIHGLQRAAAASSPENEDEDEDDEQENTGD